MTGRQAFVRELTVCLCIALPVALAAAPAARSQDDRTAFQERFNRGVSASSNWPTSDTGTSWDDEEWGRGSDEGTSWSNESTYAEGSSWGETTVSSYGQEPGWDDDEWDQVSDEGTPWDDESARAAGSIKGYDDLMAEMLREEDKRKSEEEEARRILAIDAENRRREAVRLEREQERQQAEDREAARLRQKANLLSEERERLERDRESLRMARQSARMAEKQARQAREAREQRKKSLENLANTIVTGVVNIQAAKSGIDPSSNSVTHETWNAAKRGVQILNQTMGTGRSPHCVVKAPPGTGLSDIKLC